MKPLQKKLLFLEGVLLYVVIILAATNGEMAGTIVSYLGDNISAETSVVSDKAGFQEAAEIVWSGENMIEADSGSDKPNDPYKELNKKVALTFDDGPDSEYTPILLDGLRERNVKATFFVLGKQAEKYPELIRRMEAEGHLIGNHTYSHLQLNKTNQKQFKEELEKTDEILEKITGKQVQYVRPPYGSWDKAIETELNMFPVLWDIDPLDWCKKNTECMVRNIINEIEENDIILMHDQYPSSVEASLQLVDTLKKQGYEFVTVEELFEE